MCLEMWSKIFPFISGYEGLMTVKVIDAVQRSVSSGSSIRIA